MFKKIFLSIHLLISLALFLITLIKDYNYQFQLVNYYQNYYFISLILITFSIIIFFFSNELIKIYFISIITVLSTLYAAEFFYFKKHDYESKFSSNYLFQKKK